MDHFKYKAFISYSHKDQKWAEWLHKRLETYPVPKHLVGTSPVTSRVTSSGTLHPHPTLHGDINGQTRAPVPKRLKPIFKDRDDLPASGNLGEKIRDAISSSENLIVICSPESARSEWVEQEIVLFKQLRSEVNIFCVIIDGEPNSAHVTNLECFPNAVRFKLGEDGAVSTTPAEPIATDLRADKDGKRLGVLKLVAGIIGVDLDAIVRRDLQRNRRRVISVTAIASAAMLIMGTLTSLAVNARNDANARRGDAEGLIEFMLTDLKDKLKPISGLATLESVGDKAAQYYEAYPISKHNDDALGRRSRVFHYLGEVYMDLGKVDAASEYFNTAFTATQALLRRDPHNPDRIFEHAQSAFWRATPYYTNQDFKTAALYLQDYVRLADELSLIEPDSLRGLQEPIYANSNLATLLFRQSQYQTAYERYERVLKSRLILVEKFPNDIKLKLELADTYAWMADTAWVHISYNLAEQHRNAQKGIFTNLIKKEPNNLILQNETLSAELGLLFIANAKQDYTRERVIINKGLILAQDLSDKDPDNTIWITKLIFFEHADIQSRLRAGNLKAARDILSTARAREEQWVLLHDEPTEQMKDVKRARLRQEVHYALLSDKQEKIQVAMHEFRELLPPFNADQNYPDKYFNDQFLLALSAAFIEQNSDQLKALIAYLKDNQFDAELSFKRNYKMGRAVLMDFNGNSKPLTDHLKTEAKHIHSKIINHIKYAHDTLNFNNGDAQ